MTDQREILRLLKQLKRGATAKTRKGTTRKIGYPSGHFHDTVRFAAGDGADVAWWFSGLAPRSGDQINLVGRGDYSSEDALLIDLQFNFDKDEFNRTKGGAFVVDDTGRAFLAHRGIVTRGTSRVPKGLLLQEADVSQVRATSSVKPYAVDLLIVAPLDTPDLLDVISAFAAEMRRAAGEVMGNDYVRRPRGMKGPIPKNGQSPFDVALSDYFDEFTGKALAKRKRSVEMEWKHGRVVKALRAHVNRAGDAYKSREMDLVVVTPKDVWLFEVKTSADSQSIFTAIGQLVFHGAALEKLFPNKKVVRHLVVPVEQKENRRHAFCEQLGLKVVTYTLKDDGATFQGV
ncbi:hypothetical protein PQR52_29665 [Paraburkholderia aspalathi]|uniref:hypothetical protein n=1 Tax=Paraburkholderia aspalathi TaxID=1324617 RepID=UPI0038B88543